jgi:hypothetical protein
MDDFIFESDRLLEKYGIGIGGLSHKHVIISG